MNWKFLSPRLVFVLRKQNKEKHLFEYVNSQWNETRGAAFLKHFLGLYQLMLNCEGNSIKVNANKNEFETLQAFSFHFSLERNSLQLSISLVSSSTRLELWFLNEFPTTREALFWHSKSFSFQKLNMLITNNRLLWYLSAFGNISIASSFRRFSLSEFNSVRCLPETRKKQRMKLVKVKKKKQQSLHKLVIIEIIWCCDLSGAFLSCFSRCCRQQNDNYLWVKLFLPASRRRKHSSALWSRNREILHVIKKLFPHISRS